MTIGAQFKALRLARNWTQKQAAHFSGLSVEFVRKLEHGRTNPRISSLAKLAETLGGKLNVEVDWQT